MKFPFPNALTFLLGAILLPRGKYTQHESDTRHQRLLIGGGMFLMPKAWPSS
jgi:hypothetical protein